MYYSKHLKLLLIFLLSSNNFAIDGEKNINRNYETILDRIDCSTLGTCPEQYCAMTRIKRNVKALTIACNFTEPTYLKAYVTFNIRRNGVYQPLLVHNMEQDICGYFLGLKTAPLIDILQAMPSFKVNSNLKRKCPYEGYTGAKEWILDDTAFPAYAPMGHCRLDVKLTHVNGTIVMFPKIYYEAKPIGAGIV